MIMTMMMRRRMRPAQSMSEVMVTPPELIAEAQTESETIGTCKSSKIKISWTCQCNDVICIVKQKASYLEREKLKGLLV